MNSRTTLFLAILLASLIAGYYGLTKPPRADAPVAAPKAVEAETGTVRSLLSEPLGTVQKIVVKRGGEEWIFEKKPSESSSAAEWQIVKPPLGRALGYELDRIAGDVSQVKYEISYAKGSIEPAQAGLDAPFATITLTNDAGKSAAIEIGKPVSERDTFARKAGDDVIVVALTNLRKLLKSRLLEYRDLQLWNFVPEHATHIEICETPSGEAADCLHLVRDGGQWRFDRPFKAKATPKVDEVLRSLARLRVAGWHDDDASKVKVYGLDPGAVQINVTVEETVPVADAKSDAPQEENAGPKTEKRTRVYQLQVADRGPIGDDAKVFVRAAGEVAVATLFKSAADKFKPVMAEWRDMTIVPAEAAGAGKIEWTVGGESAVLVKSGSQWTFEADSSPADEHAVSELLTAITSLKAVSFVEGADAKDSSGFANPQAEIRLVLPGAEAAERITVGGFTDPVKKLLVYVRRGDTIAKVKASDLVVLTRSPMSLRDRTIFKLSEADIVGLEITRPNEFIPDRVQSLSLARDGSGWAMRSPVEGPAHSENAERLVESLAALKADAVAGDSRQLSDFGLDAPTATVRIQFRHDPQGSASPSQKSLLIRKKEDKLYASLSDGGVIYEINHAILDQVLADFRTTEELDFNPADVQKITLRSGEESNAFIRRDGRWVFEPEPDLPVDTVKIEKILTELKAARLGRYVAYDSNQLASYDLDPAAQEITLEFNDKAPNGQSSKSLRISGRSVPLESRTPSSSSGEDAHSVQQPSEAHFAVWSGREGVFLLGTDKVKNIFLSLSELEKS